MGGVGHNFSTSLHPLTPRYIPSRTGGEPRVRHAAQTITLYTDKDSYASRIRATPFQQNSPSTPHPTAVTTVRAMHLNRHPAEANVES